MPVALGLWPFALAMAQTSTGPVADLPAVHQEMDRGDWKGADRDLRRMIEADPNGAEPHFLLGYVLFREQRATDSLAEYTAGAGLRSPTAEELIVVASDYILLKDFSDAERWLAYATQHWPENAAAWYLLGRAQYNLDHAAAAVSSFRRRLELSPKDVRAEYNLGLALEKLDRPAEAEAAYRSAIEWQGQGSTRDPQPYLDLGMLLLSQHHVEEAVAQLREAVAWGPTNALAYQELGVALEAMGRDAEAAGALERATTLAPGAEQPHFLLGRVYRRLGRSADAAAQFAEVQKISGSHGNKETPNEAPSVEAGH